MSQWAYAHCDVRRMTVVGTWVRSCYGVPSPSAARARRSPPMARVLYIGGCTRSGSTLVDRMIGQIPGYLSTGELGLLTTHSLVENRLCGCGARFWDCAFWRAVGDRAFGGWDRSEAAELIDLHSHLTRHRQLALLLMPRLRPSFARDLVRYRSLLGRMYDALHTVSGAEVIVDSTKAPAYAFALRGIPGIDLRVVHLVRDSRGTAYSSTKRQIMRDSVDRVVWKHHYPPALITMRWMLYHSVFDCLSMVDGRTLLVRYEDVVRSPRDALRRTAAFAGVPVDGQVLDFATPPTVRLRTNHTAVGNDMRFADGEVALREVDEWRRLLRPRDRRLVTALSWPLLRRWGYI